MTLFSEFEMNTKATSVRMCEKHLVESLRFQFCSLPFFRPPDYMVLESKNVSYMERGVAELRNVEKMRLYAHKNIEHSQRKNVTYRLGIIYIESKHSDCSRSASENYNSLP